MVLNLIWIAFFLVSFVVGLVRLIFFHDTEIFTTMVNSTFETAKTAVDICLGLIGVLTLWLGRVTERTVQAGRATLKRLQARAQEVHNMREHAAARAEIDAARQNLEAAEDAPIHVDQRGISPKT